MRTAVYPPLTQKRPLLEHILLALVLGFAAFFLIVGVFIVGFQFWFGGRIYPGVTVAGVPVGGLTPADAAGEIQARISFPTSGKILLQDGEAAWVVTPQEVGLFLDPGASAASAFDYGRSGSLMSRLESQFIGWFESAEAAPALVFDQRLARQYLAGLAAQIDRPVIEANLGLQGTEVIVRSGEIGRTLDIDASLDALAIQVQSLQDGVVPLVVKETPPIILDPTVQAEVARAILSQPLTLTMPEGQTAEGAPWVIEPAALAGMLAIERVKETTGETFSVGLSSEMLIQYLSNLSPNLQTFAQNARFIFNDETRQLDILQNAVIGRQLNVQSSMKAIQEGLTKGQHTIGLVFDLTNPQAMDTTTAADLGIREAVSVQSSYFYGSNAERVQNITAAAKSFHGLLIAPGETFSMASQLTDISLDNGYAEALIIVGNQSVVGVGGGVCQVSTTLFRTAFFGGFPVAERHAHAYRVYYYEKVAGNKINQEYAGLDATVYVPLVDFKFTNDTPYWLLMETYVEPAASRITWKFYSTSDGRSVEWDTTGPTNIVEAPEPLYRENPDLPEGKIKQVDYAAQGADVHVTRTVFRDGQVYFSDEFNTHYQPWQAIFEYGPGTVIPTPDSGGE
ncbi:MAG TPA: VanW family protein [Bellilinea sp.]|nr:VanW family protein [Bellilinea sp.]